MKILFQNKEYVQMTSVELSAIKKNKKHHLFTGVGLNQRLKTHIPYATSDSIFKRSP